MEPIYDVTRKESEENFRNHSLLTKTEVMYTLDTWLDRIKYNRYEIQISETGQKALKSALSKLREALLAKDLPALEAYGRRYTLDIFDDCVQCGYEIYADHELFDENGYSVPWALTEEEAGEAEDGDGTEFYVVVRIPIQLMTVEAWAEENGVKLATARQWAARERIHARKVGRNLMVSPIQYTPAAFAASGSTSSRFTGRALTKDIKDGFPFLFDEVVDVAITPGSGNNVFMVGRNGDGALTAVTAAMDMKDRLALTDALVSIGLKEHGYLRSPIGSADFDPAYRFARVACPRPKEREGVLPEDLEASVSVTGHVPMGPRPAGSGMPPVGGGAPEFSATVTGEGLHVVFSGNLVVRNESAELRLLKSIFGEHPVDAAVTAVLDKAGVAEARNYPWDRTVMLVTGVYVEGGLSKEAMALLWRLLPRIMMDGTSACPESMVLHLKDCPPVAKEAASLAGFARAGKSGADFHAYVAKGRVIRQKAEKKEEE